MCLIYFIFVFFFSILHLVICDPQIQYNEKLPIVFVYTVTPNKCHRGLPKYIRTSVEQAVFTQPDCDVILMSNFGECNTLKADVETITNVMLVDTVKIKSNRTAAYEKRINEFFEGQDSLWSTSALRFYNLEDLMNTYHYRSLVHVEADNMIYGRYTTLLPILSKYYPMTATPLNSQLSFITASIFWIAKINILIDFNNYLLELVTHKSATFTRYIDWLRWHSAKPGGAYANEQGIGVPPFAVNEMSMLAFYRILNPQEFQILPVTPVADFILNRYVCNMTDYSNLGRQIGHSTGQGIWDPNSWGQFIGGTSKNAGRDIRFTDSSHIAGQAIRMAFCNVTMNCGMFTEYDLIKSSNKEVNLPGIALPSDVKPRCYTIPVVQCERSIVDYTPLWNLHVHSKHTALYKSELCECPTQK